MLGGENGIITQANKAKENTRGGEVKEVVDLAVVNNEMIESTNSTETKKTRVGVIRELQEKGKLTGEEIEKLETQDIITIGDIEVDFSKLGSVEGTTIGDIYNEDMIGTVIKNDTIDANLPSGTDWIILGEDEDGSIMLTTSKPIEDGFTLNYTAQAWLSYEDDLNTACAGYGGTIQGQTIQSRSMTLKDVNRVTGFVEPSFNTYTFKNEATNDYANKRVNYWHPDTNGTATSSDGAGNPNYWSKNETTYKCDAYWYYIDTSDNNAVKYRYEGNNWSNESYTGTTIKNTNIILGESLDYDYVLASRSVHVYSESADFLVAGVYAGYVGSYNRCFCYAHSDSFNDVRYPGALSVRPVINLPSNIKVEEIGGEWNILD